MCSILEVLQENRGHRANSAWAQEGPYVGDMKTEFEYRIPLYLKTRKERGIGQGSWRDGRHFRHLEP